MTKHFAEHGHSPAEIRARIASAGETSLLRDTVYGAIDGTITTFAIISGVAGAGLSAKVIVALGIANVLADGFSMAASNYLGIRSEAHNHQRITAMEHRHIAEYPEGEKAELREILSQHGLTESDLSAASDIITRYRSLWVHMMLTGEHGLAGVEPRAMTAAIATFFAFIACGGLPLLPFLAGVDNAYLIASITTALTFLLIGALKSKWSTESMLRSAVQTLLIGGIAATIAYLAGRFVTSTM